MLGVVSEQCPKGGALTLNAIAGIGMLTVGIVGGPLIGAMQEGSVANTLPKETYDKISVKNSYLLGEYTAVDADKVKELADADKVNEEIKVAKQGALANITIFPFVMLICYIALFVYFKGRGGYKTVEISGGGDGAAH